MSTHVVGFKPPDERWNKMKAVWDACRAAKIAVPDDVLSFFNGYDPSPNGVEVDIGGCLMTLVEEGREGFVVDVKKLPKDVTAIKFYNAW